MVNELVKCLQIWGVRNDEGVVMVYGQFMVNELDKWLADMGLQNDKYEAGLPYAAFSHFLILWLLRVLARAIGWSTAGSYPKHDFF